MSVSPADAVQALETYLLSAPVLNVVVPPQDGAHSNKCYVTLHGGVRLIVKPALGSPAAVCSPEQIVANEVAAWRLAVTLGWSDMVAATVQREIVLPQTGQSTLAAWQVFWASPIYNVDVSELSLHDVDRAAIFDWLITHTDRGGHNWLGEGTEGGYSLRLYDHGYAFEAQGGVNSTFTNMRRGVVLDDAVLSPLQALADGAGAERLREYLPLEVLSRLVERAETLLAARRIP